MVGFTAYLVLGGFLFVKSFFQLDYQVDISRYLIQVIALCCSMGLIF
jgi:hypothetical protein